MISLNFLEMVMTILDNAQEDHISFSQINQWLGCQKQYWLQRVMKQEPVDVSSALIVGTAYHTAVEMFYKARMARDKPVSHMELISVFERVILEDEGKQVINWGRSNRDKEIEKADGVFQAFLDEEQENEVIAVEKMFRLDIEGLPPVIGRVDLVEQDKSGAIVIIDFKSAATKPSVSSDIHVPGDVDSSHQMTLYQMWGKQNWPEQDIKLRMDYLIKSVRNPVFLPIKTTRSEEQEKQLVVLMKSVYEQIQMSKAGVINAVPVRSWKCNGCGHRVNCNIGINTAA